MALQPTPIERSRETGTSLAFFVGRHRGEPVFAGLESDFGADRVWRSSRSWVARADHQAAIESWGDRIQNAAMRSRRAMNAMGAEFGCGETSTERRRGSPARNVGRVGRMMLKGLRSYPAK